MNCLGGIAVEEDLVMVEINNTGAEGFDLGEAMGDEDGSDVFGGLKLFHSLKAFGLKVGVTNGEDFINEENFRVDVDGDREGQTHVHARGIVFNGLIDKFFDFGKIDDFLQILLNLSFF